MCLRVGSKWELRRLCKAVGATALVRLGPPTPDELGSCRSVQVREIGGQTVTVFEAAESAKLVTVMLRASTRSVLDDLERAVDDGCAAAAAALQDPRLLYGGGAVEMALSTKLQLEADRTPGMEQYALHAFAKALQVVPRTLAENAGLDAVQVLADLQSAHASFAPTADEQVCDVGVDIEALSSTQKSSSGGTASMKDKVVVDLLSTKEQALRLAVDAAVTVLKIDQIIMSKPSGGPKM
jgi:T-complex protein 1 subunit theta